VAPSSGPWASVRDLSEWAYCPRAHWYERRGPPVEEPRRERARREAGRAFHDRELTRLARPAPALGGAAALLLTGAFALLAAAWLAGWL
jgi:hypothetical protein